MKIELTKEEWETIRASVNFAFTNQYVLECINIAQENAFHTALEKLGGEWKDDES